MLHKNLHCHFEKFDWTSEHIYYQDWQEVTTHLIAKADDFVSLIERMNPWDVTTRQIRDQTNDFNKMTRMLLVVMKSVHMHYHMDSPLSSLCSIQTLDRISITNSGLEATANDDPLFTVVCFDRFWDFLTVFHWNIARSVFDHLSSISL